MIYVITHKKFDDDVLDKKIYSVLYVGKKQINEPSYIRDDTGENISYKNPNYCELTGLYWIWKNGYENAEDITGLVHYRRFFTNRFYDLAYTYFNIKPKILSYKVMTKSLERFDVILPKRIFIRRTVRQFYNDMHVSEDMDITRYAIKKVCPEYLRAFDDVMNSHKFFYGNMMICKKKILDEYSSWLFKILFEIEEKINIEKYCDEYQRRVFGFISERLLQVWITYKRLKVKEFPIFNSDKRRDTIFKTNYCRIKHVIGFK